MANTRSSHWCVSLGDPHPNDAELGSKGASLRKLITGGIPVPDGFCVTTTAYRDHVNRSGLQARIDKIIQGTDLTDRHAVESVSKTVKSMFDDAPIGAELASEITTSYDKLDGLPANVAIRSSAVDEDRADRSFAGQMDTFLNVKGISDVLIAVRNCWASLWTSRVLAYRDSTTDDTTPGMAVLIQTLINAESAGVAFTADPVTGDLNHILIDAAWGLGDAIVNGTVNTDTYTIDRHRGSIVNSNIANKTSMTAPSSTGTTHNATSNQQQTQPVLDEFSVLALTRIIRDAEELYGYPIDVEWAHDGSDFWLLQARPITTLDNTTSEETSIPPDTDLPVWDDAKDTDFLWTCGNLREALPEVVTPATWSIMRKTFAVIMATPSIEGYELGGRIGGRMYMNYSFLRSCYASIGMKKIIEDTNTLVFGQLPTDVETPPLPVSRWTLIKTLIPNFIRYQRTLNRLQKDLPGSTALYRKRCRDAIKDVDSCDDMDSLLQVWDKHFTFILHDVPLLMAAGARAHGMTLAKFGPWLSQYLPDGDVATLTSGGHSEQIELESLGLLLGLQRVANGEQSRDEFLIQWGHRGPNELELNSIRPADDPNWLETELAKIAKRPLNVRDMLKHQNQQRAEARQRLATRHPRKLAELDRRSKDVADALRAREYTRSEAVRGLYAARRFILRAGELSGYGEDLFFLEIPDLLQLLVGDDTVLTKLKENRAAHEHYSRTPAPPLVIRGRFSTEEWAKSPDYRTDIYVEGMSYPKTEGIIGIPGSAGLVEGIARVVNSESETDDLVHGEILVTSITNVGWTPIFPVVGAIVTDIGAPLSHAAIVARELGLPAVVGCGDATSRIHTGDRIRVNGTVGTVEIVTPAQR